MRAASGAEVLHDDRLDIHLPGVIADGGGNLDREGLVIEIRKSLKAPRPALRYRLRPAYLIQYPVESVFFYREVYEPPSQDSTIRLHDRAYGVGIEPKVHGEDLLGLRWKICMLLYGEYQGEPLPVLLQRRGARLLLDIAFLLHVPDVGLGELEAVPDPVLAAPELHADIPHPCVDVILEHVPMIERGHDVAAERELRLPAFPATCLPVLLILEILRGGRYGLCYGRAPEIRRELAESAVESGISRWPSARSMHEPLDMHHPLLSIQRRNVAEMQERDMHEIADGFAVDGDSRQEYIECVDYPYLPLRYDIHIYIIPQNAHCKNTAG